MSSPCVTTFCREHEAKLKNELAEAERLVKDIANVPPTDLDQAESLCTRAKTWIKENPWKTTGAVVGAGLGGAVAVHQVQGLKEGFDNLAKVTDAAKFARECRADILTQLTKDGSQLTDAMKAQLVDKGSINPDWLKTATKDDVVDKLQRSEAANGSATRNAREQEHHAATTADGFALAAACLQLVIAGALLGVTIHHTYSIFGTGGKWDQWKARLEELLKRKADLTKKVADFLPELNDDLGKGHGDKGDDGQIRDGNELAWMKITTMHCDVLSLQNDFNALRTEVLQEKGTAQAMAWTMGTSAATGAISSASSIAHAAAHAGNPVAVSAAVITSLATVVNATGCVISAVTARRLGEFEQEIVDHIRGVDILVQQCGKIKEKVDEHWEAYSTLKVEVVSKRDQALAEAKAREAKIAVIVQKLQSASPSEMPGLLQQLQELQSSPAKPGHGGA